MPQRPVLFAGTRRRQHPARRRRTPTDARLAGRRPRPAALDLAARHPGRRGRGAGCPPGSSAGSRWPGRCSPTGRCCCSTSRPRASTPTPRPRCSPRCRPALAGRTRDRRQPPARGARPLRPGRRAAGPRAAGARRRGARRRPDAGRPRCGPPRRSAASPRRRAGRRRAGRGPAVARLPLPAPSGRGSALARAARGRRARQRGGADGHLGLADLAPPRCSPPVLTLMVAIVAVRTFGLGKGVLRYAERLVSHDAALRAGAGPAGPGLGRPWCGIGPGGDRPAAPRRPARPGWSPTSTPSRTCWCACSSRPARPRLVGAGRGGLGFARAAARGRRSCSRSGLVAAPGVVAPAAHGVVAAPAGRAATGGRPWRRRRRAPSSCSTGAADLLVLRRRPRGAVARLADADDAGSRRATAGPAVAAGLGTGARRAGHRRRHRSPPPRSGVAALRDGSAARPGAGRARPHPAGRRRAGRRRCPTPRSASPTAVPAARRLAELESAPAAGARARPARRRPRRPRPLDRARPRRALARPPRPMRSAA